MNKEWFKYIIVGIIAVMILPLLMSLTSLALKIVLYGFLGYVIVSVYRKFKNKNKNNKDGTHI